MAKPKKAKSARKATGTSTLATAPPPDQAPPPPDDRILASNLTLHQLFQQQTTALLDSADLSDEQKQSVLIAMSCPCCGAGGFSFTAKLKRG